MWWRNVERFRFLAWGALALLAAVVVVILGLKLLRQNHAPAPLRPELHIMQVQLPPPPPPPPPPPKEEPQKVETPQPHEQTPQIAKPQARTVSKPSPAPPGNPLTAEAGNGPNNYGLAVGNGGGDTIGGGGGGGDPFAYYDGVAAARIRDLLQKNEKTRYGTWTLTVSLWIDGTGTISRAKLDSSTGDASRDAAIEHMLVGETIGEAEPQGYPQPRRFRIGAQAPG
jgi:hypothetical protein